MFTYLAFTPVTPRAATTGAEEEVILQQVRVVCPARGPLLRRGLPRSLVDGVPLLVAPEELTEDLHAADWLA